jgi:hypothetical protein
MKEKKINMVVRETAKDSKLVHKVIKALEKQRMGDISKQKAYILAMQGLAYKLGIIS